MKLSRRKMVGLVASGSAGAALAQSPTASAPAADPMQAARDGNKRISDALSKYEIPISTEPAFQFKA